MRKPVLFCLPLLWILAALIIGGNGAPNCERFIDFDNINGQVVSVLSVVAPKNSAQTGFKIKVVFVFKRPLNSVSVMSGQGEIKWIGMVILILKTD